MCLRLRCARARARGATGWLLALCARARMCIRGATVRARWFGNRGCTTTQAAGVSSRSPVSLPSSPASRREASLSWKPPFEDGPPARRDAASRRRLCLVSLRLSLRRAGVSSRLLCALSSLRCPSRLRASSLVSGVCLVSARLNLSSRLCIYPLSQDLKQSLGIEKPLLKKELLKAPGYVDSGCVKVLFLHVPAQWVMP